MQWNDDRIIGEFLKSSNNGFGDATLEHDCDNAKSSVKIGLQTKNEMLLIE
jgi:hypothetical protein